VVFLIVLCGVIINIATEQLFQNLESAPISYLIWPPFAFYRILSVVNSASFRRTLRPYKFSMLTPTDEVSLGIIFLVFETVVLLGVAAYLQTVLPSEFGVPKP
ncbi:hypothetical protein HK102_012497, partial [Quaeritorhiza haematococci]